MNKEWVEQQFKSKEKVMIPHEKDYIIITANMVKEAIYKMGKNKAPSTDGMLDDIFKK